ncbi:hypothetical protein ACQP1G_09215 [Nocardia sp. CA-107356]|uniref:hypothetical protein n=1 Tax=Nocardia sp. CA-107356 TaxID=3239972 RepID=UPI003D89CC62
MRNSVPPPGREAVPGIEAALRVSQILSDRRQLPDQQIVVLAFPAGPLLALLREERTRLLETLEYWFAAGGSAGACTFTPIRSATGPAGSSS